MKRYNVTVNGVLYQVEVEEVNGEFTSSPENISNKSETNKNVKPKIEKEQTQVRKSITGGEQVKSPMPGTIVKVVANEGSTVKKGDVILILEAMKMENEITSPVDGTIVEFAVAKGATVNTGDVLAVIK